MTHPSAHIDPIFLSDDEIEAMLSGAPSSSKEAPKEEEASSEEEDSDDEDPEEEESEGDKGDDLPSEEVEESQLEDPPEEDPEDDPEDVEPTEEEIGEIQEDFYVPAGGEITEDVPPEDYDEGYNEDDFEELDASPSLSRAALMKLPPRDMEDFFVREEERIRRLSAKFGIPPEEQDDFWMEICSKFCREGTLGKFDPEKGAKWPTFLFRVIQNFASYYRKSLRRDINHNTVAILRDAAEVEENKKENVASMDLVAYQVADLDPVPEKAVQNVTDAQMEKYLRCRALNPEGAFFYGDWVEELLTNPAGTETENSYREQTNLFLDDFQKYLEELIYFEDPVTLQVRKGIPKKVRPSSVRVRKAIPHQESLARAFHLLRQGMTQSDIAEKMNVVTSSITNYKKRLREEASRFCELEVC